MRIVGGWWYDTKGFFNGVYFTKDANLSAACSPQTVLKLIAVVRAAKDMQERDNPLTITLVAALGDLE